MTSVTTDTGIVIDVEWVKEEITALKLAMETGNCEAVDNVDADFDHLVGLLAGTPLGEYADAERQTVMNFYAEQE